MARARSRKQATKGGPPDAFVENWLRLDETLAHGGDRCCSARRDAKHSDQVLRVTRDVLLTQHQLRCDLAIGFFPRHHLTIVRRDYPRAFDDDIDAGAYRVEDLQLEDYRRARELCDQYADADIGLVDAAVLVITERLREPKLATLDHRHFSILRPRHVAALRLLPEVVVRLGLE